MRKRVLKRVLSVVLVCVMLMSIFAALPMQAGAASKTDINTLKWSVSQTAYYNVRRYPELSYSVYDKARDHNLNSYDITVTYSTKSVGHCVATFKGTGKYTGTKYVQFTIIPRPLSECYIESPSRLKYNGTKSLPYVCILAGTYELYEDIDYTLTYTAPENLIGKGKITIKGKNNFTGTVTRSYTVYLSKPELSSIKRDDSKTISFNWSKVSFCSGYELQKKKNYGSWSTVFLTNADKTKYVDNAPKDGTKYTYRVRAYVKNSKTGKMSYSEWLGPYKVK